MRMQERLKEWFVGKPPAQVQEAYQMDCAQRNVFRFSVLPFVNILTQLGCYIIYLYVYPATFPELPRLDPVFFSAFSVAYVVINLVFAVAFLRLRKAERNGGFAKKVDWLTTVFMLTYILLEGVETVMEVEISGNIYRFLATFFMVAYLPCLARWKKIGLLAVFTAIVEVGFALLVNQGFASTNRFSEIILVFFVAGVFIANLTYNGHMKTFVLRQSLINTNNQLREVNEQLAVLAVEDPLTRLSNRRAFDQQMQIAWKECSRAQSAMSVIMIDVDDFKGYNDRYGHQAGDECLARVAACIRDCFVRQTDMVARYGGEEFIVMAPHSDPENVRELAEKMRGCVEALGIENAVSGKGVVTISCGMASAVPHKDARYEDIIKAADDRLYIAKARGKNQLVAM